MMQQLSAAQNSFNDTARILRTLADPTRLRLLEIIQHGESNVTALRPILGIPQPAVSHHLSLLKDADLIIARRDGRKIYYRLNEQYVWHSQLDGSLEVSIGSLHMRLRMSCNNGELSESSLKPAVKIEPHTQVMASMRS